MLERSVREASPLVRSLSSFPSLPSSSSRSTFGKSDSLHRRRHAHTGIRRPFLGCIAGNSIRSSGDERSWSIGKYHSYLCKFVYPLPLLSSFTLSPLLGYTCFPCMLTQSAWRNDNNKAALTECLFLWLACSLAWECD